MSKKCTYETINKIINLYLEGYSAKDIGNKLELHPATILKYLKQNDIAIRKTKITQGMIDCVCQEYQNGLSQEEVAKNNKTSSVTVRRILKENGIPIRKQEEWLRHYDLDQEYFDVVNTQNKAYFLGFMYADGNVSKENNCIQLGLQARDLHILESFKKELKCMNKPLYFDQRSKNNPNHKDIFSLMIKSEHMHNSLCKLGVVPQKSHIITYPFFLDKYLHRHFIRGVMDGDGCIHATNLSNEKEIRAVDICVTQDFCNGLKKIIESNLDIHCSVILSNKKSKIYKTVISGRNQCIKFLDWIYDDAELFLYRKYEIYLSKYKSKVA